MNCINIYLCSCEDNFCCLHNKVVVMSTPELASNHNSQICPCLWATNMAMRTATPNHHKLSHVHAHLITNSTHIWSQLQSQYHSQYIRTLSSQLHLKYMLRVYLLIASLCLLLYCHFGFDPCSCFLVLIPALPCVCCLLIT